MHIFIEIIVMLKSTQVFDSTERGSGKRKR